MASSSSPTPSSASASASTSTSAAAHAAAAAGAAASRAAREAAAGPYGSLAAAGGGGGGGASTSPLLPAGDAPVPPKLVVLVDSLVRRFLVGAPREDSAFQSGMFSGGNSAHSVGGARNAGDGGDAKAAEDARVAAMRRRCLRIIGSLLAQPTSQNEAAIIDTIKRRLTRRHQSSEKALRFTLLAQRLQFSTLLSRKWATLYFLLTVSQQLAAEEDSAIEIPLNTTLSANAPPLPRDRSQRQSFGAATPAGTAAPAAAAAAGSPLAGRQEPEADTATKRMRRDDTTQFSNRTGFDLFMESEQAAGHVVSEELLVKDLIFVFQGIEGRMIKYDAAGGEFRLLREVSVPRPMRDLIHRLCEVGYLYRKLSGYLRGESGADAASAGGGGGGGGGDLTSFSAVAAAGGLVAQSFSSALQAELTQFYRLIAVLETSISRGDMTLRRLALWASEPIQRLRMMVAMVESCAGTKGGAQAGVVHSYMHHGDPAVQAFVQHVLRAMCAPLFTMVRRWVYEGDLVDPHAEYFVHAAPAVDEDAWWKCKYVMRAEMVPGFIDRTLARKIYLIGKSLNFLRFRAHDQEWVAMRAQLGARAAGIEYGDLRAFEKSIDAAFKVTSERLVGRLLDKFKLALHLCALKKYLLLGQGDFIQCLMDGLGPSLSKPASTLYRHHLTGMLEQAIRSSNAQYEDPDVLSRLDVRLLQNAPGEDGWDVFSLDYHVDAPLNTVVTPSALMQYLKLFNFLWRMKRAEVTLAHGWAANTFMARAHGKRLGPAGAGAASAARPGSRPGYAAAGLRGRSRVGSAADDGAGGVQGTQSAPTSPTEASLAGVRALVHRCHVLWAEMTHFIYQMQYYFEFEVLECAWSDLIRGFKRPGIDLDGLISLHNRYLNQITTRGLLMPAASPASATAAGSAPSSMSDLNNPSAASAGGGAGAGAGAGAEAGSSPDFLDRFIRVFAVIQAFKAAHDQLREYAEAQVADAARAARQARLDRWGTDDSTRSTHRATRPIGDIVGKINRAKEEFKSVVGEILAELAVHPDENLRNLCVRLNFNEYYPVARNAIVPLVDASAAAGTTTIAGGISSMMTMGGGAAAAAASAAARGYRPSSVLSDAPATANLPAGPGGSTGGASGGRSRQQSYFGGRP